MLGNDEKILELLEKERNEAERRLARLNAAIAAFLNGNGTIAAGGYSAITDICAYLKEMDKPVRQIDIIRTVSNLRKEHYPSSRNQYASVYQALEFHIRHERLICCVDPSTRQPTDLKPLPPRRRGRKLPEDQPEFYDADNWFVLKENVVEGRYVSSAGNRTSGVAGLD